MFEFRELQRIEAISRGPIYSHFHETLEGLSTIRAFKEEERFTENALKIIDANNIAAMFINVGNRWLSISLVRATSFSRDLHCVPLVYALGRYICILPYSEYNRRVHLRRRQFQTGTFRRVHYLYFSRTPVNILIDPIWVCTPPPFYAACVFFVGLLGERHCLHGDSGVNDLISPLSTNRNAIDGWTSYQLHAPGSGLLKLGCQIHGRS